MVQIEVVYLVPRDGVPRRDSHLPILRAMASCQRFYMQECRLLINWRLRATPVFGRGRASAYEHYSAMLSEVQRANFVPSPIVGVFFQGPLENEAFAWVGDRDPGIFVIAEPCLSQVLSGRRTKTVAHEIGHTLGLDDHSVGTSIMSSHGNCDGLDRRSTPPWRRAHLNQQERDRVQAMWGWNGLRRTHTTRSLRS